MSLQNQQLQMKGQQISQQSRPQMQQAQQGSPVPINTNVIAQQSPQHQLQQQSVQSPSQQQQSPVQSSIQQPPSSQQQQQQSLSSQMQQNITAGVGAGRGVATVRGGVKKKGANATRKASTGGGRTKTAPFEKSNSEDSKLPQLLNQMANDYLGQAHQLGVETEEGMKMFKKYEDTMSAIQQINLNNQNNQTATTSYNLSMTQDQTSSSSTSVSSPHTVTRPIASTTTMSSSQLSMQRSQQHTQSMQQQVQYHHQNRQQIITSRPLFPPEYHNIHNLQQLVAERNRIQENLSQPNIAPNVKQDLENRLSILRALTVKFQAPPGATGLGTVPHMPPQSFINSQVVRSPNVSSPRMVSINTIGQNRGVGHLTGNDLNRMPTTTSQQMQSTLQDVSMISMTSSSSMQHQLGQRPLPSPRLQLVQSPGTQPPHSPLIQQQQLQSQGSNEDMMDIDAESSSMMTQKSVELLAVSSSVSTTASRVPPIAPAINTNIISSTMSLLNNQVAGKIPPGQAGKTPVSVFGSNASFPETPASAAMDVDAEDTGARHLLPKRKVQQLVDQIDPKERLEPEVEEMLLEIADEFISSVASFACLLAKHRKSDTLEVKDLQLHLERNWNIRIPGFASDEIRSVRKPVVSASHQQKLAAITQAKSNKAMASGQSN